MNAMLPESGLDSTTGNLITREAESVNKYRDGPKVTHRNHITVGIAQDFHQLVMDSLRLPTRDTCHGCFTDTNHASRHTCRIPVFGSSVPYIIFTNSLNDFCFHKVHILWKVFVLAFMVLHVSLRPSVLQNLISQQNS
jgi:hypothetical protein